MAENSRLALMILTGSSTRSGPTSPIEFDTTFIWHPIDAEFFALLLTLDLAKPVQRNGGLGVVDFVTAVECPDLHPLKSGALDRTSHIVLLFHSSDAIVPARADINWRSQKTRSRRDARVALA